MRCRDGNAMSVGAKSICLEPRKFAPVSTLCVGTWSETPYGLASSSRLKPHLPDRNQRVDTSLSAPEHKPFVPLWIALAH